MAVRGVIFDVSDTLITKSDQAVAGAVDAIERLRQQKVQIIAASNNPVTKQGLRNRGIVADHVITQAMVNNKPKGGRIWIDRIQSESGLSTNQLLYVGDTKYDMITASRGPVIYLHAEWASPREKYGIPAPQPGWVAAVVEHIFSKQHRWYWTLDHLDPDGRRVRSMALIDGNGAGDQDLKSDLIAVFKGDRTRMVGMMTLQDFVMLHLIASLYEEGLTEQAWTWTTYPGHEGAPKQVMGDFLDFGAKLFRQQYHNDIFVRWQRALKSSIARKRGGIPLAIQNQVDSVHLNPEKHDAWKGKGVLVIDDFITDGPTTEVARNMLLVGGATEVVTAAIGKYSWDIDLIAINSGPGGAWDPFRPEPQYQGIVYEDTSVYGRHDDEALNEFARSHAAMASERW